MNDSKTVTSLSEPSPPSEPTDTSDAVLARRRARALTFIVLVVVLAAIAFIAWWWLIARWRATTDDAYTGADMAQISALTSGMVKAIYVQIGQQVQQGDVLVELDDSDARITLAQAEADLAKAVRGARGLASSALAAQAGVTQRQSDTEAARAQLQAAETALAKAQSDLARQTDLADQGFVSKETLISFRAIAQTAQANRDAAGSALAAALASTGQAREQARAAQAQVNGGPIPTQPDVALAAASVRQAALALARTRILAPVDGVAGPRDVQLGERVAPGTPIMSIAPLGQVWVDANFKETELAALRVGQPVTLTADAFGSGVIYRGKVAGVSPATGSVLSLLPAQNATGNWIKVVQRVPVRIWLEPERLATYPLQVGLSMNVTVDLHDQSGPRLGLLPQAAQPARTAIYDGATREADARVAAVIAANVGR
ncbi:MAG: efflux RND transporter periplasmic adaptor subunit [Candidatus Competibacteraceae bacterium]|nr:efflux RND transporter periplasmic adaptor subunit [Candidatus Competibacteraceae bacterium]